jgi:hypothetical protein
MSLMGCMGWVYGRILQGIGGNYPAIPNLRWENGSKISFWHDLCVEIWLFKMPFSYLLGIAFAKDSFVAVHLEFLVFSSKRGLFIVKSFYSVLVCNDGFCFPWNNVWLTKDPLRATFFA